MSVEIVVSAVVFQQVIEAVRTGVGGLQPLCVAIDRSDGFLDTLPARFQSVKRALYFLGQAFQLVHVCEQHLHLRALLRERCFSRCDHDVIESYARLFS
jgi:hypothetical protein